MEKASAVWRGLRDQRFFVRGRHPAASLRSSSASALSNKQQATSDKQISRPASFVASGGSPAPIADAARVGCMKPPAPRWHSHKTARLKADNEFRGNAAT